MSTVISWPRPRVSVIVATHDRPATLLRAIDSILAQDMTDFEVIVIDDAGGSDTQEVLARLDDHRMRVVRLEKNRGTFGAKNAGLDAVRGEWFTFLDDDDEMLPGALSALLAIPDEIDQTVDAVTCNCVDAVSGELTGSGLLGSQALTAEQVARCMRGEHWGITKTALLAGDRFLAEYPSDNVLWYRINSRARRYYLDRAFRVYHTEGADRVGRNLFAVDLSGRYDGYIALFTRAQDYIDDLQRWHPEEFRREMFNATCCFVQARDRIRAQDACTRLASAGRGPRWAVARGGLVLGPKWIELVRRAYSLWRARRS